MNIQTSRFTPLFVVASILLFATGAVGFRASDNSPDEQAASRALVDELIIRHGGMDLWTASNAVRYTHISHMPHMPSALDWMVGHEFVEKGAQRAYGIHPMWKSRIARDGESAWGKNWIFPNGPKGMATIHYHMAFMPWLSQDEGTQFGAIEKGMLPGDESTEYDVVTFWSENTSGEKVGNTWGLYIHPETGLLGGFTIDFGSAKAFHRIDALDDSSGLLLPSDWVTYAGPQLQIIGYHVLVDVDLNGAFDETMLAKPDDADE